MSKVTKSTMHTIVYICTTVRWTHWSVNQSGLFLYSNRLTKSDKWVGHKDVIITLWLSISKFWTSSIPTAKLQNCRIIAKAVIMHSRTTDGLWNPKTAADLLLLWEAKAFVHSRVKTWPYLVSDRPEIAQLTQQIQIFWPFVHDRTIGKDEAFISQSPDYSEPS